MVTIFGTVPLAVAFSPIGLRHSSNGPAFVFTCQTLRFCATSSVIFYSFMSSLMLSSHLFLCLPTLLFPCTCMFNIFLVVSSPSLLDMAVVSFWGRFSLVQCWLTLTLFDSALDCGGAERCHTHAGARPAP